MIRKLALRLGVALSLFAAVAAFIHAGDNHASNAAGSPCAVCRVFTAGVDVPVIIAAPDAVSREAVIVTTLPVFVHAPIAPLPGRGPPSA